MLHYSIWPPPYMNLPIQMPTFPLLPLTKPGIILDPHLKRIRQYFLIENLRILYLQVTIHIHALPCLSSGNSNSTQHYSTLSMDHKHTTKHFRHLSWQATQLQPHRLDYMEFHPQKSKGLYSVPITPGNPIALSRVQFGFQPMNDISIYHLHLPICLWICYLNK